ncbi:GyrI-like domain-containing protein [Paucisalibacillus sp. EB02]|uniref:GyrI-like domain-containing protein n=1 Tax=Paucisalibacillus sp. EB02 TaxID=1347087 RepID=UPI0005AA7437|nr:effector binding domain-containing protein [Paucisalibacillus sp. EB02]
MQCKKVKKEFKVVGMKGSGAFSNFGNDVPALAQQVLLRSNEIQNKTDTEVAFFEPKEDENHLEGHYYVGLAVNNSVNEVPVGMEYIETEQHYVTTRGKITRIGELHSSLLGWADEQGFKRNLDSYIVETYHPMEDGEEEVEIYLPIHD